MDMSTKRMTSRATSFDVAALAGVSQSAVSRAFTPGSSIAKDMRAKVLEAARKLNYVPNSIASSLTTKRTNIVALILGNLGNPFYVHVLHEFSRQLQALRTPGPDLHGRIRRGERRRDYARAAISDRRRHSDGRPAFDAHDRRFATSAAFRSCCSIDTSRASTLQAFAATIVGGGRLIAEAFLAAGAQSFAMITGDPNAARRARTAFADLSSA